MTQTPSSRLQLLGTFQLVHHAQVVNLGQARLEELVALLALYPGKPFTRSQIAYLFWPDSTEPQARTNVRNLLYKLRQAWPELDDTITVDRRLVMWRPDVSIVVDVQHFKTLLGRAEASKVPDERVRLLAEAAAQSQGDLLPDCYSDWILAEREQQRSHYAVALEAWIGGLLELRRYDEALTRAQRLRDHDPLRESIYRQLMQIHSLLGDRAAALHVYQSCASILYRELGVEPAPATRQLHDQLKQQAPVAEELSATPQTLQRPRMSGRHAEWQQLLETWRAIQEGPARCVIIWGEAGIGKTRLAEELIDWVRHHGHAWASSRSYAAQGTLVYAPVAEWLRAPVIQPLLETIDDLWRVEIARLLPEVLAHRPDLPPPGQLQETWQQQRFFEGILYALQAVPGPLLLHLDDMQWCGQEMLHFVHFLLHNTRKYPLLLVGAIRSEEMASNVALASTLEALRHTGQLIEVHLEPLSQEETAELAELTAGAPISPERAAALYATSEGHPLYLVESLRGGLEEITALETNQATTSSDAVSPVKIPAKIYHLIAARLGHLSPAALEVVAAAAVVGRRFTYQVLYETLTLDELALVDALDELWTRRIVREQPGDSYDFSHDRIREVCYQEISRARRRLLHRQVAAALKTNHANTLDEVAGEVAAHYAQAGDREQAYAYYRRAAKLAWTHFAVAQAEAMFDAALAFAPGDPAIRLELLHEQNQVFRFTLNFERWQANVEEQRELLASLSVPELRYQFQVSLDRSVFLHASRDTTGGEVAAVEAAHVAIGVAEHMGDRAALAQGYQALGDAQWYLAHMAEAGHAFAQAAHHARAVGNHALEAKSLEWQGATGMFTGMPAQPLLALAQRAFDVAEAAGDKRRMCAVANKLGYGRLAHGLGDFDRIEQEFRRGLLLAAEVGARFEEETMLSNLCVLFTVKGDYRQALNAYHASVEVGQRRQVWRYWRTRHYLGALRMQMGDLAAARVELVTSSDELRQLGSRHYEVMARCDLGLLYQLTGEQESARAELTYILELIQCYGDLRFEALVSTRLAYALEESQRPDDAQPLYERGQLLHEQMGQHYYALNARAGLARLAAQQRNDTVALDHVQSIWESLRGQSTEATVETARTLRTCYTLFRQHDDPQATEILNTALAQLHRRAATIDNPQIVSMFWELSDHRFFQEEAARGG